MATQKAAATKTAQKKAVAKKTAAKKATQRPAAKKSTPQQPAAAKKTTPQEPAAKKTPPKSPAKKVAPREAVVKRAAPKKAAPGRPAKKSKGSSAADYTKPDLRDKVKEEVMAGDKGGRPGQWSARKAQLVAHEYEAKGGGYKHPGNAAQKSLKQWGDERWHTEDGKQAVQGEETHRYLPDAAWKELSPEERKATDRKKVTGSKRGKQFVANTEAAAEARKHATEHNE